MSDPASTPTQPAPLAHGHSHAHGAHGHSHGGVKQFDVKVLVDSFAACAERKHDLPIDIFVTGCDEVCVRGGRAAPRVAQGRDDASHPTPPSPPFRKKIVSTLHAAFGIAAADISEKCEVLVKRRVELEKLGVKRGVEPSIPADTPLPPAPLPDAGPVRLTCQYVCLREIADGKADSNSWSYVSGARSLLRLMWFLDFVYVLIDNICNTPGIDLSECAKRAYVEALHNRHPWVIRTAIYTAIKFLPTREKFVATLADGEEHDAFIARFRCFLLSVDIVRKELWSFYKLNKIDALP